MMFRRRSQKIHDDGTIGLDIQAWIRGSYPRFLPLQSLSAVLLFACALGTQYSAGGTRFVLLHLSKWGIALLMAWVISRFHHRTFLKASPAMYWLGMVLLLYVFALGWVSKGAQRWIQIAGFSCEPSEFFKMILPLRLTQLMIQKEDWNLALLLRCLALGLPVVFLILKQPDLGTALIISFLSIITLLAGGLPWRFVIWPSVGLLITLPYLWHALHEYQRQRVLQLLTPHDDPLGRGYHVLQSIIAVGSGGLWGKGWGGNTQSQLDYLPEHATDFVFALWAEEWGFLGSLFLISLYAWIVLWLFHQSEMTKDRSAAILLQVIACQLGLSAWINMNMVIGLLPVVGVPLPVLSFGGSNALMLGIALGIALSCLRRVEVEKNLI